jgi:hypothetical protein
MTDQGQGFTIAGLCRVCRVNPRARARGNKKNGHSSRYFKQFKTFSRDTPPAHPAHPAQASPFVPSSCAGSFFAPCTPCTGLAVPAFLYFLLIKKMMMMLKNENKARQAAFLPLAIPKQGFDDFEPPAARILENGAEKQESETCETCANWIRDRVGDGTGIGVCVLNVNPRQLKWPGITACQQHQGGGDG